MTGKSWPGCINIRAPVFNVLPKWIKTYIKLLLFNNLLLHQNNKYIIYSHPFLPHNDLSPFSIIHVICTSKCIMTADHVNTIIIIIDKHLHIKILELYYYQSQQHTQNHLYLHTVHMDVQNNLPHYHCDQMRSHMSRQC